MRPIDADALIEKCGDWYVEEGPEEGFIGTIKTLIGMQPTVGGWISVEDELPELATLALVCDASSGKMAVARYIANNQWVLPAFFPAVTHWMLLPEAPKEDVDDA